MSTSAMLIRQHKKAHSIFDSIQALWSPPSPLLLLLQRILHSDCIYIKYGFSWIAVCVHTSANPIWAQQTNKHIHFALCFYSFCFFFFGLFISLLFLLVGAIVFFFLHSPVTLDSIRLAVEMENDGVTFLHFFFALHSTVVVVPCAHFFMGFYFAFIWNSIEFLFEYAIHVLQIHIASKHNKNQTNRTNQRLRANEKKTAKNCAAWNIVWWVCKNQFPL